jgi:hypothetical protein
MKVCGANVPSASKPTALATSFLLIMGHFFFGPVPPYPSKDESQTTLFKDPARTAQ